MNGGMLERMLELVNYYIVDDCVVEPEGDDENLKLLFLQCELLGGNMQTQNPGSTTVVFKKARVECGDPEEANRVADALNSIETTAHNALEHALVAPQVENLLRESHGDVYRTILFRTNQAALRNIPR